ncbi:U4/U6-U5 tri-snRNP component SNU23 [Acrasis kona]|uniref:U4/U6-U5 tri-snRNP component SNU23 n=1 Tax=Acrasis kona TaxID=1008807 RepID=A0AAW2YKG6_9EUKA
MKSKEESVGTFGRKQWDEEVYKAKAMERANREETGRTEEQETRRRIAPASERQPLRAREQKVELESIVGRRGIITGETSIKSAVRRGGQKGVVIDKNGGFYCNTCDCVIKDSISYLDHINSRGHVNASGMNTRAVRATVEDVKNKLSKAPPKVKKSTKKVDELEQRILNEQIEKIEKKKEEEHQDNEEVNPKAKQSKTTPSDEDVMSRMGFSGFK